MARIAWTKSAAKQLLKIDTRYRKPITQKVGELTSFPNVDLDLKKLSGNGGDYRLRVGDYRIIFNLIDGEPVVIEITRIARRTSKTW